MSRPDDQAIIEAFASGDFVTTAKLCEQALGYDPQNMSARHYLQRVEAAWDNGLGIPVELRRLALRAESLIQLRQITDAESVYQEILAQMRNLKIPRWPQLEQSYCSMETYRVAESLACQAEDEFKKGHWHEALEILTQAQRIAPQLSYLATLREGAAAALSLQNRIAALVDLSSETSLLPLESLREVLVSAHDLSLQYPDNAPAQELLAQAQALARDAWHGVVSQAEECIRLADDYCSLELKNGLLRRAQTLVLQAKSLPGKSEEIESLEGNLYERLGALKAAQTLDSRMLGSLGVPTDLSIGEDLSAQLAGLTHSLRSLQPELERATKLLPELEFCLAALRCRTLPEIADLARGKQRLNTEVTEPWGQLREGLLSISARLGATQADPDAITKSLLGDIENFRIVAANFSGPQRIVADATLSQWSSLLTPRKATGKTSMKPEKAMHHRSVSMKR